MAPHVERLIGEIRALPQEERREVLAALSESSPLSGEQASHTGQMADETYQLRLLGAGLIREVRLRRRDQTAFERFTPVPITGAPLSQTIIEERG